MKAQSVCVLLMMSLAAKAQSAREWETYLREVITVQR